MTKDEVVALGIASQKAKDYFGALCLENTAIDPAKRVEQVERYERARAEMMEAMNRHHAALGYLGTAT
jgi:hypothetical protein